jgi:hypothetical protein
MDIVTLHLWPEEIVQNDGQLTTGFSLEEPGEIRKVFWYRLPASYQPALAQGCDPFVLAVLFTAMRTPANLVVHGPVSPSLLHNLEEYQAVWVQWFPRHYARIEIQAGTEQEQPKAPTNAAVCGFSGGLDSSFTVYRHRTQNLGHAQQNLTSAIFIHGFDISLSRVEAYNRAADRAKAMLDSLGVEMIPMAMNLKQLGDDWEHSHAAALASCLMLLQGGFSAGLIASSYPYSAIQPGWGSNPITDWLLSSASFPIIHDGAAFTRFDKVRVISQWPAALQYLRVCLRGKERDKNCCRCRKCVRAILYFRFVGRGLPPSFEQDVSDLQLLTINYPSQSGIIILQEMLAAARASGAPLSTRLALHGSILLNRLHILVLNSILFKTAKRLVRKSRAVSP